MNVNSNNNSVLILNCLENGVGGGMITYKPPMSTTIENEG